MDAFAYRALACSTHVFNVRDDSDDGLTENSKSRVG